MLLFKTLVVQENYCALLFKNGKFDKQVQAGKYTLWGRHWRAIMFDLRRRTVTIPTQEIMTKDHIPVRVTMAVDYQVVDPRTATQEVENYTQQLYLDVQLALRSCVAELPFDDLLDRKNSIGDEVRTAVVGPATRYGIDVLRTAIKDVTMPGNIRTMMLKTVEAEKSAKASLIRAREEVAAARARANAAKMMADNPAVLKLKELETLTELAKSPGSTVVYSTNLEGTNLAQPGQPA